MDFSTSTEAVGKQFYLYLWTNPLVENIINGIENRHIYVHPAVDFLPTLRSEISLGNHFHLYLRRLHVVALTYHRTERAVAGKVRVARYKQVAQVNRIRSMGCTLCKNLYISCIALEMSTA